MMQDQLSLFYNAKIASSLIDDTENYLNSENGTMIEEFLSDHGCRQSVCFVTRLRKESIQLYESCLQMIYARCLEEEWAGYLYSPDNEFAIEQGMFDIYCTLCDSCLHACQNGQICPCSLNGLVPAENERKSAPFPRRAFTHSL